MASRFTLLFLFSILIATSFTCSIADADVTKGVTYNDDLLIRQVVDHDEELGAVDENTLLNADHHFGIFKRKFGKSYATQEEHDHRFGIFKANLRPAWRHHKVDPTAVHGVTQFSDLSPNEFRRQFLGLNRRLCFPSDAHQAPYDPHQFASCLLHCFSTQLQRLYDIRARKIAVSAVGKLGCMPQVIATYEASDDSTCVETSNDVVRILNDLLKLLMKNLNDQLPGAKFVFPRDNSGTSSYGNITDLSSPYRRLSSDAPSDGQCMPGIPLCKEKKNGGSLHKVVDMAAMLSMELRRGKSQVFIICRRCWGRELLE